MPTPSKVSKSSVTTSERKKRPSPMDPDSQPPAKKVKKSKSKTKPSKTATSTPAAGDKVRLHITPLTPATASTIVPLADPSSISFHELATFPEKSYAFVELSHEDAEKLKKKYNGTVFRGVKMSVEEARRAKPIVARLEEVTTTEKKEKTKKEKGEKKGKKAKDMKDGVLPGVEIRDGRQIQRGWTATKTKSKKSDESAKKTECLFKTVLPPSVAANTFVKFADANPSDDKKAKKKEKKKHKNQVILKEFENTTRFPQFLKMNSEVGGVKTATEFVEEVGWVDEDGAVVDDAIAKKRKKKSKEQDVMEAVSSKVPAEAEIDELPESLEEDVIAAAADPEDEVNVAEPLAVRESANDEQEESLSERSAPENSDLEDVSSQEESPEVSIQGESPEVSIQEESPEVSMGGEAPSHSLSTALDATKALSLAPKDYRSEADSEKDVSSPEPSAESSEEEEEVNEDEDEVMDSPSAASAQDATNIEPITPTATETKKTEQLQSNTGGLTALFKPKLSITTTPAPAFKFFDDGSDDEDEDNGSTLGDLPPATPLTFLAAGYRSGAPTPDTAVVTRFSRNAIPSSPTSRLDTIQDSDRYFSPVKAQPTDGISNFGLRHVSESAEQKLLFVHSGSAFLHGLSIWNALPVPKILTTGEVEDWRGAGKKKKDVKVEEIVSEEVEEIEEQQEAMENVNPTRREHWDESATQNHSNPAPVRTGAGSGVVGWAGKKKTFDDDFDQYVTHNTAAPSTKAMTGAGSGVTGWAGKKKTFGDDDDMEDFSNTPEPQTVAKAKTGAGSGVVGWAGKKKTFGDEEVEEVVPVVEKKKTKQIKTTKVKPGSISVKPAEESVVVVVAGTRAEVWKDVFYKKRGEWNREWKRRRREVAKAKRKRENSKRTV